MKDFDPSAPAAGSEGIFGLPHGPGDAAVHVLPVPFDATTSYRKGTALGPAAVLAASRQVDLFDLEFGRPYEAGIHALESDPRLLALNDEAGALAALLRTRGEGAGGDPELEAAHARCNEIGAQVNDLVRGTAERSLADGRLVALLGGDHSTPFGAIEACVAHHGSLGILHFDAHADLRDAYEGFTWSHASILANVLERITGITRVVQVGVRDLCEEEAQRIEGSGGLIETVFDRDWAAARLGGRDLSALVREKLALLPERVYVTCDVDGLDPALCPSTGTPVPGGLGWHEMMLWLTALASSGRRVVGLDLVEVSPGPEGDPDGRGWDAIVGARLLYKLIGAALVSRGGPP